MQPGFFNVVALPLFTVFTSTFPAAGQLLSNMWDNQMMWTRVEEEEDVVRPTPLQQPRR